MEYLLKQCNIGLIQDFQHPNIAHALKVRQAASLGDFVQVCQLYSSTEYMGQALLDGFMSKVRLTGLKVLLKSCTPSLPVKFVAERLGFVSPLPANGMVEKDSVSLLPGCSRLYRGRHYEEVRPLLLSLLRQSKPFPDRRHTLNVDRDRALLPDYMMKHYTSNINLNLTSAAYSGYSLEWSWLGQWANYACWLLLTRLSNNGYQAWESTIVCRHYRFALQMQLDFTSLFIIMFQIYFRAG